MQDKELLEKLSEDPDLRERMEEILNIAENTDGTLETADEAEERAIEVVRRLGKEVLLEWSITRSHELNAAYEKRGDVERDGKKKLYWHSSFGTLEVQEQCFKEQSQGQRLRPFRDAAKVQCRGYSKRWERIMVDFGADDSQGNRTMLN